MTWPKKARLVLGRSLNSFLIRNVSSLMCHWRPRDKLSSVGLEGLSFLRSMTSGRGCSDGNLVRMASQLDCTLQRFRSYRPKRCMAVWMSSRAFSSDSFGGRVLETDGTCF